jgi:flagellar basal-body rod modification protein FlgD
MQVTSTADSTQEVLTQPADQSSSGSLQREDFMMLLLTQLKHQDPLKPMDDEALMTQFTQLNSLEELQGIHKKINLLSDRDTLTEAAGLIGKTVTVSDPAGEQIHGLVTSVSRLGEDITLTIGGTDYPLSALIRVQQEQT